MASWDKELELAQMAAKQAGIGLRESNHHQLELSSDHWRDIKLPKDHESEKLILELLSKESHHSIITEESGTHGSISGTEPYWIVDPLDGTMNYNRRIPIFSVSIALWYQETPILGVIYDVSRDELFVGKIGCGAWCNNISISVSRIQSPREGVLATGFPVNRDFQTSALEDFVQQIQRFRKVRLFGSAAISLAYVAAGRLDAYFEEDIMLWDIAAGVALVQAAGGWVQVSESLKNPWARSVRCAAKEDIWQVQ
jgi:myo-inositol-1(or 4)-monophosphatase